MSIKIMDLQNHHHKLDYFFLFYIYYNKYKMSTNVQSPVPESSSSPISPSQEDKTTQPTIGGNPNETIKKNTPRLTWTNETEALLQGWADIASCFKWMHENSFRKYSKVNNYFAIPIIVLSTLSGTLNVSLQGYVPASYLNIAQAGIGGLGIFTGILTTLQNLFKYAQLSEAHNNVSIGWSKLNRNIQIELSVERDSRKDADSFIKICRSEYDRLIEQSPTIPLDIINAFKKMYKEQNEKKKQEKLNRLKERENLKKQISKGKNNQDVINLLNELEEDELILPDICDSINHTKVYKNVLNNSSILDNQIDLTTKSSPIEQEIKDTMRDKINELEAKTSGLHQYKLAMIGERLAPLHHQNNVLSHYKEFDNIKDKLDLPKNFVSDNKSHLSIGHRENPVLKGIPNELVDSTINKVRKYSKSISNQNKFTKIADSFNFKNNSNDNLDSSYSLNSESGNERPRANTKIDTPKGTREILNEEIKELSLKGLVKNISNIFGNSQPLKDVKKTISESVQSKPEKNIEMINISDGTREDNLNNELSSSVQSTYSSLNDFDNDGNTPKISPRESVVININEESLEAGTGDQESDEKKLD